MPAVAETKQLNAGEAGRSGARCSLRSARQLRSSATQGGIHDRTPLTRRAVLRRGHPATGARSAAPVGDQARPPSPLWMRAHCRSSSPRASRPPFVAQAWPRTKRHCRKRFRFRTPSPRDRLRRSRLYLPGNEPKYFINAALHGARRRHSRSGRLGSPRGERCGATAGAQCLAGGGFRRG